MEDQVRCPLCNKVVAKGSLTCHSCDNNLTLPLRNRRITKNGQVRTPFIRAILLIDTDLPTAELIRSNPPEHVRFGPVIKVTQMPDHWAIPMITYDLELAKQVGQETLKHPGVHEAMLGIFQ